MPSNIPADLIKLGFTMPSMTDRPRLLVGTQGLDKTGKTHFWCSAPDPIGVINLDIGLEGVVEKWIAKGKRIWTMDVNIPPITDEGKQVAQVEYIKYFVKTRSAFEGMLKSKEIRTVVIDSGSDWWDLAKLAEFGKINPAVDVKQAYQGLNQLFRSLIRRAYETDKNLIITHKMKEKYSRTTSSSGQSFDSWDGKSYKRTGFGEDNYLIQVNIEHYHQGGAFGIRVINCRQDMGLAGMELGQDDCSFLTLAQMIYPETKEKDWL